MMDKHDADALAPYAGRYELIRLTSPNELCHGKPGGKQPSASNWRLLQPLCADDAKAHFAAGKNIGVRLRDVDLVLDVDPRHGGNESLERLAAELGIDFADWPIVWTGSGGRHIYMKKPANMPVTPSRATTFASRGRCGRSETMTIGMWQVRQRASTHIWNTLNRRQVDR